MDKNIIYLGSAFAVLWVAYFIYLLIMDSSVRNLKRRLAARETEENNK